MVVREVKDQADKRKTEDVANSIYRPVRTSGVTIDDFMPLKDIELALKGRRSKLRRLRS